MKFVDRLENILTPDIQFFNQLDSIPWEAVAKHACGPAAIAMGINYANKRAGSIERVSPLDVLFRAGHATELPNASIAQHYLVIKGGSEGEKRSYLPIGNKIPDNLQQDIDTDPALEIFTVHAPQYPELSTYKPVYTLANGWFHPGSKEFLSEFGLQAEMFGSKNPDYAQVKTPIDALYEYLQQGNILVASVDHTTDSSHLVMIPEMRAKGIMRNLRPEFKVYNPLDHKPKWINAVDWHLREFRGYGTIIHGKED